jgi:hypothetical protein
MKDTKFLKLCEDLESQIQHAYTESLTLNEAERLAARFLEAQMLTARVYANADLDARMKKSGVKAIKAAVYMEAATSGDKKPSDVMLNATVDLSKLVQDEQRALDEAEVTRDRIKAYSDVFIQAHVYFRQMSKGNFNG